MIFFDFFIIVHIYGATSKNKRNTMDDFFNEVESIADDGWRIPQEELLQLPLTKDCFEYIRTEEIEKTKSEIEQLSKIQYVVPVPVLDENDIRSFQECILADEENNVNNEENTKNTCKTISVGTQTETDEVSCNCSKSRCIQRYCPCFNSSGKCGPSCTCRNCMNT